MRLTRVRLKSASGANKQAREAAGNDQSTAHFARRSTDTMLVCLLRARWEPCSKRQGRGLESRVVLACFWLLALSALSLLGSLVGACCVAGCGLGCGIYWPDGFAAGAAVGCGAAGGRCRAGRSAAAVYLSFLFSLLPSVALLGPVSSVAA